MENEDFKPDPPLTEEQIVLVNDLAEDEVARIDKALLSNSSNQWRKVSRIVGTTMNAVTDRISGVPDVYYSQRIRHLIEQGLLEAQGNPNHMRHCEVRLVKK